MRIAREDIALILDRVDPLDVLDLCGVKVDSTSYHDIRSACPIHNGKDPNFCLYYDSVSNRWRFKCFSHSCEKRVPHGTDLVSLVMTVRGLRFQEAIMTLANLAGVEVSEEKEDDHLKRFERDYIKSFSNKVGNLRRYEVDEYPEITIENVAADKWELAGRYLESPERKSSLNEVSSFGLYPGYDKHGQVRLYIPIHDDRGRLVGVTGRLMGGVLNYLPIIRKDGSSRPPTKYDNNPGFKKSGVLYNLHQAKNFSDNGIIVVEGPFDVIRMHNYGYPNTVAKLGSILSDKQIALLYKYSTSVILLVEDSNKIDQETGKILTRENKEIELDKFSFGMKVRVAYLDKDPDSSGKDEVDAALANAELVKI